MKEDTFACLNRGNDVHKVQLTQDELVITSLKNPPTSQVYLVEDVLGCELLRSSAQTKDSPTAAFLCVYIYPRTRRCGLLKQTKLRQRLTLVLRVHKPGLCFEENLALAVDWKEAIQLSVHRRFRGQEHQQDSVLQSTQDTQSSAAFSTLNSSSLALPSLKGSIASEKLLRQTYVVILNPKSGQGRTVPLYQERVAPLFREAGIQAEMLITQAAGHALSFTKTANFSGIHGIVSLGGDGLLFEIVNGLRSRSDFTEILNIPVGVIAGGSGNGLARSLASYSGESEDYLRDPVLCTALGVAKGKKMTVNITEIDLDGNKGYSFLSVGWGLLADIDIESEVLRSLGEPRFTLWSFVRLMNLKHYKAELQYVEVHHDENGRETSGGVEEGRRTITDDFLCVYSSIQSYIGSDLLFAAKSKPNDGLIHLTYMKKEAGRSSATKYLLYLDKGLHVDVRGVVYTTVSEFSISAAGGIAGNLVVDGERVEAECIKVKISPNPLTVFAM